MGNGNGTFQAPLTYPLDSEPEAIAVGDFNGDGREDLVLGSYNETVNILLGNGDGTFQEALNYPVFAQSPYSYPVDDILVVDLTRSGRADLVGSSSGIDILLSTPVLESFTTLTSSLDPSTYGEKVTLTATLSPLNATGTVSFYDQTGGLADAIVQGGVANLTTSKLPTGTDSLRALYKGDSTYPKSLSPVLIQTVNQIATTTGLTSSPDPSTAGQTVTFTATVSPRTAKGTIAFRSVSGVLGTVAVKDGTAAFSTSTLPAGTHGITAEYSGNENDMSSLSPVRVQKVE